MYMTKQKKIYTIDDLMELAGNYITNQESLDKIMKYTGLSKKELTMLL